MVTDDDGKEVTPQDPITQLREIAGSLREIFESMTAAGFTDWQACRIVGVYLSELGKQ